MKSHSVLLGPAAMATAMTGTENESVLEARIVGSLGNPGIFRDNIMMFDCSQIPGSSTPVLLATISLLMVVNT